MLNLTPQCIIDLLYIHSSSPSYGNCNKFYRRMYPLSFNSCSDLPANACSLVSSESVEGSGRYLTQTYVIASITKTITNAWTRRGVGKGWPNLQREAKIHACVNPYSNGFTK